MNVTADLFPNLTIADDCSIRDAMVALNVNGREVVLVKDNVQCIVGLVTDGDIRRALLSGSSLSSLVSSIMTRDFFFVDPDADRAFVLDLMKGRSFGHVPVLDRNRRLTGVHFLRDLIGSTAKPNVAVIMAGGQGTRLRPVTKNIPKPMLEVAGRPMLERIVLHLVGHGIQTIFIAVHYMAEIIERHFGDGRSFGCRIEYLREKKPLGTGGALSLLPVRPTHPLLVLNGDQVMRADVSAILDAHTRRDCVATIGTGSFQVPIPFGTVVEHDGRLIALEEKPTMSVLINRGLYVLSPEALDHVPTDENFPITALFESLLRAKRPVGTFYFEDYWLDVGQPSDLNRANGWG